MADFDFDDFLDEVGRKLTDIASATAGEFRDAAIADGKAFVAASRESLKRWTKKLAADELTAEEFEDLLKGEKDLAEMAALKQTVITKVQLNKFKDGLIGIIKTAALAQLSGGD